MKKHNSCNIIYFRVNNFGVNKMQKDNLFIGRTNELALLEKLYNSQKFEMLIMHGRRRVGKSYLLGHFAKQHQKNTVYFIGDKSSEKTNVP